MCRCVCAGLKPGDILTRNSLNSIVCFFSFAVRGSSGNRFDASSLNTLAQLGSRTTIGVPAESSADRASMQSIR